MKLSKILQLSFNMLVHSKLRSWLTIVGIFIGVAAVVAIISLGQSLQKSVSSQISGLGQDIITISSGGGRAFGPGDEGGGSQTNVKALSERDIDAIKLVPNVKSINGIVSGRATIKYQTESTSSSIQGIDPAVMKDFILSPLDSGRYLFSGETKSVVVGNRFANNVFKTPLSAGSLITINGKPFRIVGIISAESGFGGSDNTVFMPLKDAREMLSNTSTLGSDEFSSMSVKLFDASAANDTGNRITAALRNSHRIASGARSDFSITSAQALQQRFSSVTSSITLFLIVLAAVSLLVGGIGVANTMFTSVLEKTKDIGIMKAIGAKNIDVLMIFLLNSGMLGLVGGILGVIAGVIISYFLPFLTGISLPGARGGFMISIDPGLLIFALLFSIILGMISGAIPAYNASKLRPVDALRYE